jgi:hypothetical protein
MSKTKNNVVVQDGAVKDGAIDDGAIQDGAVKDAVKDAVKQLCR